MTEGAFRRIDIDQYNEDLLLPTDLYDAYPLEPSQAAGRARELDRDARGLVARGDAAAALSMVLQEAPYGDDSYGDAKRIALTTILSILLQTNQASMTTIIKGISQAEQDILMKYLYKGMEQPADGPSGNSQCAALLAWHQKLLEVGGTGCITRVLSDHRRV